MAEWLRLWTADPLGYDRMGSNPIFVASPHWFYGVMAVSYTHLRAHETDSYLVCRLLLEKKKNRVGGLTSNKKG